MIIEDENLNLQQQKLEVIHYIIGKKAVLKKPSGQSGVGRHAATVRDITGNIHKFTFFLAGRAFLRWFLLT
jgi:hypothetical protein